MGRNVSLRNTRTRLSASAHSISRLADDVGLALSSTMTSKSDSVCACTDSIVCSMNASLPMVGMRMDANGFVIDRQPRVSTAHGRYNTRSRIVSEAADGLQHAHHLADLRRGTWLKTLRKNERRSARVWICWVPTPPSTPS